jgi:hypothetical protein
MSAHPDKMISVFGRAPKTYSDYEEDYQWQRYLYAAYLLGAGPNTLFHYSASFQMPERGGRSGGVDSYADWGLELGPAMGAFHEVNGVYSRVFANGLVALVASDAAPGNFNILRRMYSPEGRVMQGTVQIQPGRAIVLLDVAPRRDSSVRVNLATVGSSWRWASVAPEGHDDVLHLGRTPKQEVWEHDLLLDPIRSFHPKSILSLRVRFQEPGAMMQFVAEVDDASREHVYVVVQVRGKRTANSSDSGPALWFRSAIRQPLFPYVEATLHPAIGEWTDITLDGQKLLADTHRYTFRRWSFVRGVGTMDLTRVTLARTRAPMSLASELHRVALRTFPVPPAVAITTRREVAR